MRALARWRSTTSGGATSSYRADMSACSPAVTTSACRSLLVLVATLLAALPLGCSSEPRLGYEEAREMFESRGVQPGEPLPQLDLVALDGQPVSLDALQGDRPLVLVTASLTCNVARHHQPAVDQLAKSLGDTAEVIVIYTIDAHPQGDVCPYTGTEWVPKDNEKDQVLVRQPTDMEQRLALARDFQHRFSDSATVLIDRMDNSSWKALGSAPNLGLLIDAEGIVRTRQGWVDADAMRAAIDASSLPGVPGDFDGDGLVDGADLGILLSGWGACSGCAADLTGDGVIEGADLGELLANWSR